MTRPKVPLEQRQRTAQACESCKRRKQKCNGQCPCNTCGKRKFKCIYSDRADPVSPSTVSQHPAKRRMTESDFNDRRSPEASDQGENGPVPNVITKSPRLHNQPSHSLHSHSSLSAHHRPSCEFGRFNLQSSNDQSAQPNPFPDKLPPLADESVQNAARSLQQFSAPRSDDPTAKLTDIALPNLPGIDEEAIVYSQTRMLQDPTGRLLYVGDSATLSFLQLIRMMVESVAGQSRFTTDPRRHKIMESQFSLPSNTRHSLLIPHKITAKILADSFFINTHGVVHVFDHDWFFRGIDSTYTDPLSQDPTWLCLLNLVFAIGLMLATPAPGSQEEAVVEKLREEHTDRAEVFYLNAKSLNDPMTGLEDADFWSVQALLLMTVYMLAKSKRNTAFALLGMAIRSAYALGLHREETLSIFSPEDQTNRCNVWRSLFIMDRFLSCSLGRPPGISEDDCSGDTLKPHNPINSPNDFSFKPVGTSKDCHIGMDALEAVVRSCSAIGTMLRRVYQQRKVSTKLAQEIANICWEWPKYLNPALEWKNGPSASPRIGIAILHANLFYCHSILLLSRPFFLFILNDRLQQNQPPSRNGVRSHRSYASMERFTDACVISSSHTIKLVRIAYDAGYLPRRNPFVIYFLFAAALIILANEFAALVRHPSSDQHINSSITIMEYCAKTDPQANRLLWILEAFRDVILDQRERRNRQQHETNQLPPFNLKANINPYGPTGDDISPLTSTTPIAQIHVNLPPVSTPSFYSPHANLPNDSSHLLSAHNLSTSSLKTPLLHYSRTTQPIEPSLSSPAPPNPLSPIPDRQISFGNIFDFSALGPDRMSVSEESSGEEHNIEFDALWGAWPSNTPAAGTPKPIPPGGAGVVQGVSDSVVPLFGVLEP